MEDVYSTPLSNVNNDKDEVRFAGFWIRAVASFIDSLWIMPVIFALGFVFYGNAYFESEKMYLGPFDIIIQYALPLIFTISFWIYKSATPGKMAVKLKIVDAQTLEPASKKQLILRYIGYYPSMIALFIGFIWVAFDKKKQGWHDKIANTLVVYT